MLEALESRKLFNVSAVFDANGQLHRFVVHQDGSLTRTNNSGTVTLNLRPGSSVKVAHAFLNGQKKVALDVVYTDGQAFEYSPNNGVQFLASNVLDVGHAVGKNGAFRVDVLFHVGGAYSDAPDQTGQLVTITNAGSAPGPSNVRWVNDYVDVNGNIGTALGQIVAGGNLLVTRSDSTGSATLHNAPDGATQDITDYGQTTFNGKTVADVTFGRFAGTNALEFDDNGAHLIGNGTDVKVGG